jgi:prepilin-type N-terminal cleavage/methylation domain-containing protein
MQRRKAFTLIELLVVMAIIALLVSILAPSLTKILGLAKDSKCQTNLDAVKKSMLVFAARNKDFYPHKNNVEGTAVPTTQAGVLSRFAFEMGLKGELFQCPATEDEPLLVSTSQAPVALTSGSYSYTDCGDIERRITGETENDVVFMADRAPATVTDISPNHEDYLTYVTKGGTAQSEIAPVAPATGNGTGPLIGRIETAVGIKDNIYTQDTPAPPYNKRDDSYLLKVDAALSS